jgi:hypothetical protein
VTNKDSHTGVKRSLTVASWLFIFLLSPFVFSCAAPLSTREKGALGGTALGAGTGAIIGAATGHTVAGTLIGAGLGGLTGAILGDQMQNQQTQQAEQQRQLEAQQQEIERQKAEIERLRNSQMEEDEYVPVHRPVLPPRSTPRKRRPVSSVEDKEKVY